MARASQVKYKDLLGLEDERRMAFQPLSKPAPLPLMDYAAEIPGTYIEKKIYHRLTRMGVRFQFQYNWLENKVTDYKESGLVPDFIIPELNDTVIECYGTYWHSGVSDVERDQLKQAYAKMLGYTLIQHGVPLYPQESMNGAKYIIWWEDEINLDLDHLFARDLPELEDLGRKGVPDDLVIDTEYELDKKMKLLKNRITRQLVPRVPTVKPRYTPKQKQKDKKEQVSTISQAPWLTAAKGKRF